MDTIDHAAAVAGVSGVSTVTPRHGKADAMAMLGISRPTLHRYAAALRPLQVLTATIVDGQLLFSDEDLAFLARYKAARSDAARAGMAQTQRERIAQLCAGLPGGRHEAEAVRRELRALADSGHLPGVPRRIRALLERVPHLRTARMLSRLVWYYATFHTTTDLVQLESAVAPTPATVERTWRQELC